MRLLLVPSSSGSLKTEWNPTSSCLAMGRSLVFLAGLVAEAEVEPFVPAKVRPVPSLPRPSSQNMIPSIRSLAAVATNFTC